MSFLLEWVSCPQPSKQRSLPELLDAVTTLAGTAVLNITEHYCFFFCLLHCLVLLWCCVCCVVLCCLAHMACIWMYTHWKKPAVHIRSGNNRKKNDSWRFKMVNVTVQGGARTKFLMNQLYPSFTAASAQNSKSATQRSQRSTPQRL